MAGGGASLPKPLLRVAGLGLLERSLLTLRAAGIEELRVVVGADRQRIAAEARRIAQVHGLAVELVDCPDFERRQRRLARPPAPAASPAASWW